jgi:S1-C subfamily serine protease
MKARTPLGRGRGLPRIGPRPHLRSLLPVATLAVLLVAALPAAADFGSSIVTIKVTTQAFDQYSPWRKSAPSQEEIQGTVLDGHLILTVARPLADLVTAEVSKHGNPARYPAEVVMKDYVAGIALLTVREPAFFADLEPVTLAAPGAVSGQLRAVRWEPGGILREFSATVVKTVVDYFTPVGATLAHVLSTDMDHGGSGEAVFEDGKLLGLAYHLDPGTKALSVYAVEVLQRLFADLADGAYGGYPSTWEYARGLEGDLTLKRFLGLRDDETGVLVTTVPPRMSGAGVLRPNDVILSVDGKPIDDSGLYRSESFGMLHYESLLFLNHQVGDSVELRVVRDREQIAVSVPLLPIDAEAFLVPPASVDEPPDFVVYGGLVFQELTRSYLQGVWGSDWWRSADSRLLFAYDDESLFPRPDRRRIVVLNRVLPHAVNAGYQSDSNLVLDSLNGTPVRDLAHLASLLASPAGPYAVFRFAGGDRMVLAHERATAAEKEIMESYGLQATSSVRRSSGS